jgi:hypothetical protein
VTFSVVTSVSAKQNTASSPVNTSGANLFVVACAQFAGNGQPPTLSDSAGNSWPTPFLSSTEATAGNGQFGYMFFLEAPTTSSNHTFQCTNGANGSIAVLAASGSASSPLDKQGFTVYEAGGITSETPGSVTPSQNGELCVAAYAIDTPPGSSFSINGGYTIQQVIDVAAGNYFGIVLATLIQTSSTATNPALSRSALTGGDVAMIATFKAASPPSTAVFRRSLSPIGSRIGSRQMQNRWKRSDRGGILMRHPLLVSEAA